MVFGAGDEVGHVALLVDRQPAAVEYVQVAQFAVVEVVDVAEGKITISGTEVFLPANILVDGNPVDAVYFLRTGRIPLTVIPMLVMIGTGVFLLIQFLRRYPKPEMNDMA